MKTEEKNRGFRFERHNLSRDEIRKMLFLIYLIKNKRRIKKLKELNEK